ncbi:MAG: HAMP domain-containing protein [Candidatus Cloacimonetes bacterium]|nr:HAMP domain-containing protein [Candidatus Cloacimonadota bacterium]
MRRMGIMWKQFLRYCFIIVITSSFIVFFASREIKKHYLNTIKLNLENQAELIEKVVTGLIVSENIDEIDALVKEIGEKINTRITIVKSDGLVLGDSKKDPNKMENHSTRPEIIQALQGKIGSKIRYSSTVKENMLYVAIPIKENDKMLGVVRTSSFIPEIKRSLGTINQKIIYTAIVLAIFALLFSILSSRTFTKPIKEIANAAEKIKNGEFATRTFTKRKDELGELSNALNEMARELQRLFTNLNLEREELQAILSSMVEGLVVLDKDGKIALSNRNFLDIVGVSDETQLNNKRYWEVLQNVDIDKLVKSVSQSGEPKTREIQLGEKVYLGSGSLVSEASGEKLIVVLHNITEIKRLEKVKTDFVANIAHELKTPLTAIKGFAETLEEEADFEHKRFLQIIKSNTDRLINIVSDLLLLSNLETQKRNLVIEKVDLEKLVTDISQLFVKKLGEKKIVLSCDISPDTHKIKADSFLLEQIFINLIDNAIKYTEQGEINIKIYPVQKNLKIIVQDTGIGIPKEDIDRIFERFYVVDKSRSRKYGDTGLGLSIVKHIVLAHNGKIDVESEVGEGSKFIITFPYYGIGESLA